MNPLDILILVILAYCMILGFFRGLIRELAAIAGVLCGYFAAMAFYPEGARYLSQWLSDSTYRNILGFLGIYFTVNTLVWIIALIIKKIIRAELGKWVDRLTGALFGGIKAILISSVLLVVFIAFLPKNSPVLRHSLLAPHVTLASRELAKLIPAEVKNEFKSKFKQLQKAWELGGKIPPETPETDTKEQERTDKAPEATKTEKQNG